MGILKSNETVESVVKTFQQHNPPDGFCEQNCIVRNESKTFNLFQNDHKNGGAS